MNLGVSVSGEESVLNIEVYITCISQYGWEIRNANVHIELYPKRDKRGSVNATHSVERRWKKKEIVRNVGLACTPTELSPLLRAQRLHLQTYQVTRA